MQKISRLGQLFHAVHTVFDRNPSVEAGLFHNAENSIVIIKPFADDTVLDQFGLAKHRVDFHVPQLGDIPALEVTVAGVHGDHPAFDLL